MYNLIFALLIGRTALSEGKRKLASWAAAASMIMPIGLVLRGLDGGALTFAPVVMVGAFGFIVSAGMLIAGSKGFVASES